MRKVFPLHDASMNKIIFGVFWIILSLDHGKLEDYTYAIVCGNECVNYYANNRP